MTSDERGWRPSLIWKVRAAHDDARRRAEEEARWHEESLAASLAQRSNEREETRQLLRAAESKMLEARGFSQAVSVVDCLMIAS